MKEVAWEEKAPDKRWMDGWMDGLNSEPYEKKDLIVVVVLKVTFA